MSIQKITEDAVKRNMTLVQTALRSSQSISGPGIRAATFPEQWMGISHWALDVDNGNLITRFELRNNGDEPSSCIVTRDIKRTGDYSPLLVGSKGKTMLNDAMIEERAKIIIAENPDYKLFRNDCQSFAMLLSDNIACENNILVTVNSVFYRFFRKFGW